MLRITGFKDTILFKKNGIRQRRKCEYTTDPKATGKLIAGKSQYSGFLLSRVPGG